MKNVIVIGGGPAGISAALYAKRGGAETTVFTMGKGPLAGVKIDNYYGFPGGINGGELIDRGLEQARALGIEIVEEEVVDLDFTDSLNVVTTENSYSAGAVIMAMGSPRKVPKVKNISDFEGRGVSYCAVCDGFFFKGKDVAVLGSGEYASHEAGILEPIAASVRMIGEDEADAVEGGDTLEKVILKDGTEVPAAGLFVAMGSAGSADLARKLGAAVDGSRIVVDENMATNVPGLYAAGDCTGGLMQVSKSVYQGAVAGLAAVKALRK
ncbi:MAG: NAD(P)/FAD-dependent oxidoreductase [Anaerovoracaceae bacterium]|jgi:thioredoxin reductase (NADPH)